jgi:SagB-type dehydrogenase family enzyme
MEYFLRTVPSAGALYPIEFYIQLREVEGFVDGIYHFDVRNSALKLLYKIDSDEGVEFYFEDKRAVKGVVFLLSSIYYRSSWKYKDRAFRYCLLDCGHALGSIEASAYLQERAVDIRYKFDRRSLNSSFGFGKAEFFLSAAVVGAAKRDIVDRFDMKLVDINPSSKRSMMIEDAYLKSSTFNSCKKERKYEPFSFDKERFKEVIFSRRSIRGFQKQHLSKGSYIAVLEHLRKSILSDCDEFVNIYSIINRVDGLRSGLYKDDKLLKEGDFSQKAGYLCLEQSLGSDSSVTFFLTSDGDNYQVLYQKAGFIGYRLYLVCEYLGIGCSGIGAYYDDEVAEFLGCEDMILYGLTIGS